MPKLNFRQRFVISIIIIGSLPVFAGLFITSYVGTRELRRSIGANFGGLAEQVAHKVELLIDIELGKLKQVVQSEQIRNFLSSYPQGEGKDFASRSSQAADYLKENIFKGEEENYAFVSLLDRRGKRIAGVSASFLNFSLLDGILKKGEFNYSKFRKVFISDFYFLEKINEYLFFIVYPLFSPDKKEFLGLIRIDYRRRFFGPAIEDIKFGETGHAMLIDSAGEIIICPLLPTGEHVSDEHFLEALANKRRGWVIAANDAHGGRNSIVGFNPIVSVNRIREKAAKMKDSFPSRSITQWYSFIRQDPEETYRPITLLMRYVFFSGFLLVSIIALLGVLISRRLLSPLNILRKGAEMIGKGDLDYRLNIETGDEFEELAREFNRMVQGLKEAYLKGQQLAVLEEREWISREIHDLVAQNLAYLKIQLKLFHDSYASYSEQEGKKEIAEMKNIITETYVDVREIISGFRTKIELGEEFIPTLKEYLEKFSLRNELELDYLIEEQKLIFSLPIEISLLRIIQEGLANIRKHSRAKNARVEVRYSPVSGKGRGEGEILIIIEDDGIGFDLAKINSAQRHLGLDIIRERVEKLKGKFKIDSVLGRGTRLEIIIPVEG